MKIPTFSATLSALLLAVSVTVSAATVSTTVYVPGQSTGNFGYPSSAGVCFWCSSMVIGWNFTTGQEKIKISATGQVDLLGVGAPAFVSNANGIPLTIGPMLPPDGYSPLEEAAVDAGALVRPRPVGTQVAHFGALMAAFVPESIASQPTFKPMDQDFIPMSGGSPTGIPSSALFLVGEGPFLYQAPSAGKLFLGINDAYAFNNRGGFLVTVAPVPLPPAVLLFTAALGGFGWLIRAATRRNRFVNDKLHRYS